MSTNKIFLKFLIKLNQQLKFKIQNICIFKQELLNSQKKKKKVLPNENFKKTIKKLRIFVL